MADFKDRLKEERIRREWSQSDLAEELSLAMGRDGEFSKQTISQYERGARQPTIDTTIAFAEIFHVTVDYLLGLSDHMQFRFEEVSKHIGLTDLAIRALEGWHNKSKENENATNILSSLIEGTLLYDMDDIAYALELMNEIRKQRSSLTDEEQEYKDMYYSEIDHAIAKDQITRGLSISLSGKDYVKFQLDQITKSISDSIYKLVFKDENEVNSLAQ